MSLRQLKAARLPRNSAPAIRAEIPATVLARYDPALRAANDGEPGVIGMYGQIGEDFWSGDGWTAKRVSGLLRSYGSRDVIVNINSPGGDVFEGLAIYNLLRDHPGKVTARVIGIAASAASFIAMAADSVEIAKASSMMIHNTQSIVAGDRQALRDAADWMEQFDNLLADIYAERTATDAKAIGKMLDNETWLLGQAAVDAGFADGLVPADVVTATAPAATNRIREAEEALRNKGLSRTESQAIISRIKSGLSDSAPDSLSDSGSVFSEVLNAIRKG